MTTETLQVLERASNPLVIRLALALSYETDCSADTLGATIRYITSRGVNGSIASSYLATVISDEIDKFMNEPLPFKD